MKQAGWLTIFPAVLLFVSVAYAQQPDYTTADPELKIVRVDSDAKESFLGMALDSAGRLFVGGREALFLYEPAANGLYQPRRELHRFPKDTWIYDIAIRGDDLYVLTVSALYRIPGAVKQRGVLKPERLLWGIPLGHVHQCFHGLAIGPEGDLYVQHGDPLWYYGDFSRPDHWGHWTWFTADGKKTPFTGGGGVLRLKPDGSSLQIFSRGQRNSCGLAFDHNWNLFSNDNDHEGMPLEYVPGRLLHVTPRAYFSWPNGWLVEKHTNRADLLQTMNPNLGRFVPVGQAYYDDAFLGAKYQHNLLVARWGTRAVPRYPITPNGATFQVEEVPFLVGRNDARPVGVAVGRGGRVFITIAYMAHNESSPVYRSDLVMVTRASDSANAPFAAYEETGATMQKLFTELNSADWSRRHRAHIELNRRGGKALDEAATLLGLTKLGSPSIPHLVWLAAASKGQLAAQYLAVLFEEKNDALRFQAIRALAEFPELGAPDFAFKLHLDDDDPQIRHACLLAFFNTANFPGRLPDEVAEGSGRSRDTYLRQTAALLLAERAGVNELEALCESSTTGHRLLGVLAAGFRLTLPGATNRISAALPLDASRTNEYVIPFADGTVDLRDLGRVGNFTVADHWRAAKHTGTQEVLFDLLLKRLDDPDEQVRQQAAHFLRLLNDPRSEPRIARIFEADARAKVSRLPGKKLFEAWAIGPFPDGDAGFAKVHAPETGPVNLSAELDAVGRKLRWQRVKQKSSETRGLFKFNEFFGGADRASFYVHFRVESSSTQPAMLLLGSDDGVRLWQNGRQIWDNPVSRAALPYQDPVFVTLSPGANDFLVRVNNLTDACGLYVDYRIQPDAQLVLPEPTGAANLAERLKSGGGAVPEEVLKVDWTMEATKGNAEKGRALFTSLACAACHAINAEAAGGGGPSLADAAKRFTVPYLVEAILQPNKTLSPVFKWTALVLRDGEEVNGLVVGETVDKLELLLTNATRRSVSKAQVKSRELQNRSPMPEGLVRSAEELRDLLTYILMEKP